MEFFFFNTGLISARQVTVTLFLLKIKAGNPVSHSPREIDANLSY